MYTNTIPTDSPQKIIVESQLVYTLWTQGRAYAGFEAQFEVKTLLVGDGAAIKATCFTEKGKKIGKVEGAIVLNRFRGKILIPETVKPDDYIYLDVEVPKLKLSGESNSIPVRPPLQASSIKWSKKEVHRDAEVDLSCVFTSGVEEGDTATVIIYEYDNDGYHDKVVTIPTTIKNGKVGLKWKFIYQEDTDDIPTEKELKKYGKSYNPPEYFFVVMVDNIPVGNKQESGLLVFKDTVHLTIREGRIPQSSDAKYTITTADGKSTDHTPDAAGIIQLAAAPPGPFTVHPAGTSDADKTAVSATFKTGVKSEYIRPEVIPLVDGHMHIQSNNCCPLPVQLGVLARKAGLLFGREIEKDRKALLDTMCAWYSTLLTGRFGKVGRLSSDLAGKLYMNDLNDMDMKTELIWSVFDAEEEKKLKSKKQYNTDEKLRKKAGEKAGLSDMSRASAQAWQESFLSSTSYYFENTTIAQMCLALCMDLSFTHFWGRFGLPVYLEAGDNVFYINDFVAITLKRKGLFSDCVELTFEDGVVTPESEGDMDVNRDKSFLFREKAKIHLHGEFTGNDRFGNTNPSFYRKQFAISSRVDPLGENDLPLLKFTSGDAATKALAEKRYIHFLAQARGEEKKWFEDYTMQCELTKATMVNYPMSLFGGYHYDPRRHLIGEEGHDLDTMAENLVREHAFFTASHDKTVERHLTNGVDYEGAVLMTAHPQLNDKTFLKSILAEHQRTTDAALDELFPHNEKEGFFWCIKLYPRLGWAPDDFARYPNLTALYEKCGSTIPLMAHCSLGGMSAADYYLYERYDDRVFKDSYDLKKAEDRFDGAIPGVASKDSPVQWRNVLKKYQQLKICLAHFGGYDTWKDIGSFEKADKKLADRADARNPDKYDKYDKYRDWVRTIAELVQKYDNVYTDISYFKNSGSYRSAGDPYSNDDDVEYSSLVVENLVYLLKKYSGLKERIMVGTDWLMIELESENGIGEYMTRMFETLKEVSRKAGYDAWHQFAVINPLRYLGLVEEKKGGAGPFEVDTGKLERFGEVLKGRVRKKKLNKNYSLAVTEKELDKIIKKTIQSFSRATLAASNSIKVNGKLLILQNE